MSKSSNTNSKVIMVVLVTVFGVFSLLILIYNKTDKYMDLMQSSTHDYYLKKLDSSNNSEPNGNYLHNISMQLRNQKAPRKVKPSIDLECPEAYISCTQDVNDFIDFVLNKQQYNDCDKSDANLTSRDATKLFTHVQGDWFLFNESSQIYLNVTKSNSFKLHRLYFSDLNIT